MMATLEGIWRLLLARERRTAVIQFGLMLVGMVIETFSIGLVIPLLALLSNTTGTDGNPIIGALKTGLGMSDQGDFVAAVFLGFFLIYLVKTVFLAFLAWRQAWFAFSIQSSLSQRLFTHYLRLPFTFHLQRNSAELIRNVTLEVGTFSETLYFGLQLATEILVLIGIGSLLLAVEPFGALAVVGVLGIAGWGFLRFTRSHITAWGRAQQHHQGLRLQHLQQGLGSVKDVKLLGREQEFINLYGDHTRRALRSGQRQLILQQLPRLWLELLAVGGLVTLVLVMVSRGHPLDALLPTLGLFAAAAFRLMPSITRVINAIQTLRYGLAAISNLNRELDQAEVPEHPEPSALPGGAMSPLASAIAVQSVGYRYPGADRQSLTDVSLTIRRGESVGLIGASGAGKSTLVDVLLGLLPPTTGRILIDDRDMAMGLRGWQNQIGYVPQSIYLTDDTLRRNVAFGVPDGDIDDAAVWKALAAARMEEFARSLTEGLDLVVGERGIRLSGGQRQRIGIARALYHNPSVLVLDEATSALDAETETGVMDAVRALKGDKTIIIVTHRLSTIQHCDRLYRLDNGRII